VALLSSDEDRKLLTEDIEKFTDRYVLGRDKCESSSHFLQIKIPNGKLTTQKIKKIANLAQTYSKEYDEITDRQNLQLHWIDAEML